eukprot:TRINITY_DN31303_c0_g1_i1.p1 TRINITY_DN31303_c0_g1~~TRINITY_DN31303_c0_g1_i1.p1  ORF type:complete len:634 (+),score=126.84 TRINITY_DN31303_c0_g1_i1:63-1904(+)
MAPADEAEAGAADGAKAAPAEVPTEAETARQSVSGLQESRQGQADESETTRQSFSAIRASRQEQANLAQAADSVLASSQETNVAQTADSSVDALANVEHGAPPSVVGKVAEPQAVQVSINVLDAHAAENGMHSNMLLQDSPDEDIQVPHRKTKSCVLAEDLTPLAHNVAMADGAAQYDLWQKVLAEFIGTFFLVLTVGVSVASATSFAPLAIGFVLAIQIYSFGKISGGMYNPAVTLAVLLSGRDKLKILEGAACIGAQFMGGMIAGWCSFGITEHTFCFDWKPLGNGGTSFMVELFFTAALCSTVLSTGTSWDTPNDYFGFAIGSTVTASAYACSGRDQGSFNPAVTWGINIAHYAREKKPGELDGPSGEAWVVYLLAPLLGAVLAAGLFRIVRRREYLPEFTEAAPPGLLQKLIAEFVGTFYLVMTVVLAATAPTSSAFAPVAIGLMLACQIYTFGPVSGGLFNPAVALAVVLSARNKLPLRDFGLYSAVQFLGATIGGNAGSSFMVELLFTSVLCSAVLSTGTSKDAPNQYFGFAIGGAIIASAFTCGHLNQCSFNPAVTWGVNLANLADKDSMKPSAGSWFLFLLAPYFGGALAAGVFWITRIKEIKEG